MDKFVVVVNVVVIFVVSFALAVAAEISFAFVALPFVLVAVAAVSVATALALAAKPPCAPALSLASPPALFSVHPSAGAVQSSAVPYLSISWKKRAFLPLSPSGLHLFAPTWP